MDNTERKICRLCLKVIYDFNYQAIEEITKEIFGHLLLNLNLTISEEPVMCGNCAENLQECHNFKSTCLYKQDFIASFPNDKNEVSPSLIDIYLCQNENIPEGYTVCRFCMELVKNGSFMSLNEENKDIIMMKVMLQRYIPELDLSITKEPVICLPCHNSLQSQYNFVLHCSDMEEKIMEYYNAEDTNCKGQIQLSSVLQFTSKLVVKFKSVGDDVDVMKMERTCFENGGNMNVEVKIKNENFVEMDGQGIHIKHEEIAIKTEQDNNYNSFQVLPQPQSEINTNKDIPEKPTYQCELCTYRTKNKSHLRKHLLSHKNLSEVNLYVCDICSHVTKYKGHLKRHMLTHKDASDIPMYRCQMCIYETRHKNCLTQHLLVHEPLSVRTMFKCEMCTYQAKRSRNLKRHISLVHTNPSEITVYNCQICVFETTNKRNFKQHMSSHKMYKCDICPFKTKYKVNLNNHTLTHTSPSEVTVLECEKYSAQSQLKCQKPIHKDASEEVVFKCDKCEYETSCKSRIQPHMRMHENDSEVYKCDFCTYEAKNKFDVQIHLLVHKTSDVQVYKCDECTYETKCKKYLKNHILTHKSLSDITVYKCQICSHETKLKVYLKRHMLTHKSASETTLYKCDICAYKSKYKSFLTKHILTHKSPSEVTMYQCEICAHKTKYKSTLKKHLLTHKNISEVTMFRCVECLFETKYKNNLTKHMKSHTVLPSSPQVSSEYLQILK